MRNNVQKDMVKRYILEKVKQGQSGLSKHVADNFAINRDTVYEYIKELVDECKIERIKRGEYRLVKKFFSYTLLREAGDLDSDMYAYDDLLAKELTSFSGNIKHIWAYAFSEMINNVIDHSFATQLKVIISQDALGTAVLLKDNGIGIFKKICDFCNFSTYEDALCELIKGKFTTDSTKHSGEGIFFTSRIMDDFAILSDGVIFGSDAFDEDIIENVGNDESDEKYDTGTIVYMALSNSSKKEIAKLFHRFENEDGEFTKSNIPLKNLFDASPVSRSQAKRLCNRLEKFEEVVLDFDGVEWIGQGFAHQIFSVFAKDNPQIIIKPINMCEDVARMIRHVMA